MRFLTKSLIVGGLVLLAAAPARAQSSDNEAMAQTVASTLKQSGRLKDYRVGVKFQDGIAWLLGTVTSQEQMETAQTIAEEIPGVAQVVNKLEIAGPTQPAIQTDQPRPEVRLAVGSPLAEPSANQTRMASNTIPTRAASQLGPPPPPQPQTVRPTAMPQPTTASRLQPATYPVGGGAGMTGGPVPMGAAPQGMARQVAYDHPSMPGYAWPSYAAYPNYAALTYPQQYSPAAWPYIGPFYPYPQVPLGWRKVTLEWDDGWWFLDFKE